MSPPKRRQPAHRNQKYATPNVPATVSLNPVPASNRWRLPILLLTLVGLVGGFFWWGAPTYFSKQAENALLEGRYEDADEYWQYVLRMQPRRVDALIGQATASRHTGDLVRAKNLLATAESFGASQSETKVEHELIAIQNGGSEKAITRLPSMLLNNPEQGAEILDAFATGFEVAGAPEQAVPYIDKWLETSPNDRRAVIHKAELLASLQQWKEAEAGFRTAMNVDAMLQRGRRGLARVLLETGRDREALEMLDAAIAAEPRSIPLRLLRCKTLLDLRQNDEAITGLREVLAVDEFNFFARHALASTLVENGDYREVCELIEPLIGDFPDDVSLNYLLASAYTEIGESAKADAYLQRHLDGRRKLDDLNSTVQELKTKNGQGAVDGNEVLRLAKGYLQYRWDDAEPWLVKANSELPDSIDAQSAMTRFQTLKKKYVSKR